MQVLKASILSHFACAMTLEELPKPDDEPDAPDMLGMG